MNASTLRSLAVSEMVYAKSSIADGVMLAGGSQISVKVYVTVKVGLRDEFMPPVETLKV